MSAGFDLRACIISIVALAVLVWAWRSESKFHKILNPVERMWSVTLAWLINLCIIFCCIVFTLRLYLLPEMFAFFLAVITVFLIVLMIYLFQRWKISYRILGSEVRQSVDKLAQELERLQKEGKEKLEGKVSKGDSE